MKIKKGVLRISKDLGIYEYSGKGWRKSKKEIPDAVEVIKLFKAHNNLKELVSKKDSKWLKGFVNFNGDAYGERICVLPNGIKLEKGFSLFAKHLIIHDEKNSGWDVLFQNKGGGWNYVYSIKKKEKSNKKKYEKVRDFEKIYPKLHKNAVKGLDNKKDFMAVPMLTLLETLMRVGNEMYYKKDGHKGLTTLKKSDVKIFGETVRFDFLGKDGVPQTIIRNFPETYTKRLKKMLKSLKKNNFIFMRPNTKKLLTDRDFEKVFIKYCGEKFYPHIVRSYFATKKVEDFLRTNKGEISKKKVEKLFIEIADRLGHKKFSKKKKEWETSYKVTMKHYINPKLIGIVNRGLSIPQKLYKRTSPVN